ncbi:MarR family EPS-associated transcriptional regulator [Poseidonibacter ostreae]|uniref:MarR family EPS-associated transcriptional regulator n=1 Tax=Poseidonibacter ostreae TaxID=2654171 RepID=UPI001D0220F8|nr:MarR family EPS-associated transcriptional regulator [Poseidonibacter ostreae]
MSQEIELEILKNITNAKNQKSMAEEIGYSVGKINYILKGLIEKGLIKSEKFLNTNNKVQYKYLLTEDGIKDKIDITEKFIKRKKEEYEQLQSEMNYYTELYSYAKNKEYK